MVRIDKEAIVNAPLEEVFGYVATPANWLEIWPSLISIKDVKTLPNGGYSAKYRFKMAGRILYGTGECVEIIPNRLLVIHTEGGIKGTLTWTFRSQENRTKVTLSIECKIPIPVLGFLAEPIITQMASQETALLLNNLGIRFMFWNQMHK